MDESEMANLERWADIYDSDAHREMALDMQAAKYVAAFLDVENINYSSSMCYRSGKDRFRRKDGLPISQEDIRAVDRRRIGQGHHVRGNPGDMEIIHEWAVDSSD